MRHPLVPAAVVLVLLAAYALAGVALAGNAAAGDAVTVEGTVTGVDGAATSDAVVLVGEYAMLAKLSPSELRAAADENRSDLTVVEVGSDGTFAANVSAARADGAVGLSADGVSETVRLGNQGATLSFQLHERRPQSVHAAAAPTGPGGVTRLHVDLHNDGDHAVENLSVTLTALPDGWQVVDTDTGGTYDAAGRTLAWDSVGAGDAAEATLTVAVPGDVAVGAYAVGLRADSDTNRISVENATVEVREETSGPTGTRTGSVGDDETTASETPVTATPSPAGTSAPGFGVVVALVALAAAALALRGDRR
jgi:PGF-CTERM protein